MLLVTADDMDHIKPLAKCFLEKAAEVHESVSGEVHVAAPLSDSQLAEIDMIPSIHSNWYCAANPNRRVRL